MDKACADKCERCAVRGPGLCDEEAVLKGCGRALLKSLFWFRFQYRFFQINMYWHYHSSV